MSRFTHDVVKTPEGFIYRIFDDARDDSPVISQSGPFLLEADADRIGRHWASDKDLMVHLKNR